MTTKDAILSVNHARNTLKAADEVANDLAYLLSGRLRHVSPSRVKALKKELSKFNMHTLTWKD